MAELESIFWLSEWLFGVTLIYIIKSSGIVEIKLSLIVECSCACIILNTCVHELFTQVVCSSCS